MAEHAFVSAREMPHLLSHAAWAGAVSDRNTCGPCQAASTSVASVCSIVPDIGVADPTIVLLDDDARFDSFPDAGLPSSISSEKDFTVTAPSSNSHALSSWKVILPSPGSGEEALLVRSVRPERSIDFVGNDSWRYLVLFN